MPELNTLMDHVEFHTGLVVIAGKEFVKQVRGYSTSGEWHLWPIHMEEQISAFDFPSVMTLLRPALFYMIVLSVVRYILQHYVFRRFAMYARDLHEVNFKPDQTLDKFMTKKNKITPGNIGNISQVTGKSEAAIVEYIRTKKKSKSNEQKISKFIEALWRSMFYGLFVIVGVRTMLYPNIVPWVLDNRLLVDGWPEQHNISDDVLFYYAIELGAYFHQLLWTEVSRSDSIEMIAHHFITISLMILSYMSNFNRYGTMLLILHDVSDVFLELAKCFNYVSQVPRRKHFHIVCDTLFGGFVISFFVCRLVLFPKVFLVSTFAYTIRETTGVYWYLGFSFMILMFFLLCLHVFWFYLTIKMVIRLFSPEGITKDVRSDDEGSDDEFTTGDEKGKAPIARKKTKKAD